jgi:hypothetical protein
VPSSISFQSSPIVSPYPYGNFSATSVQRVSIGDALVQFFISCLQSEINFHYKQSQVYDGLISYFNLTSSNKWHTTEEPAVTTHLTTSPKYWACAVRQ